jgi:hypothetical protein
MNVPTAAAGDRMPPRCRTLAEPASAQDNGGQTVYTDPASTRPRRCRYAIGIVALVGIILAGLLAPGVPPPASAAEAGAASKPAQPKDETLIEPRHQPSAVEILQELMKKHKSQPPVIPPSTPGNPPDQVIPPTSRPAPIGPGPRSIQRPLRADGTMLVDRIGRLVHRPEGWFFTFESEGKVLTEPPMEILPNRDLETMEVQSVNATRPVKFRISAEVTEYRGANYLLVRKVLVVHDQGNIR